jgi:DnaJ-class molecular chaperone
MLPCPSCDGHGEVDASHWRLERCGECNGLGEIDADQRTLTEIEDILSDIATEGLTRTEAIAWLTHDACIPGDIAARLYDERYPSFAQAAE